MNSTHRSVCPDCGEDVLPDLMSRREFLAAAGGAVAVATAAVIAPAAYAEPRIPQTPITGPPESVVKTLYNSLTDTQKGKVCLAWDNPLRKKVDNNWAIVEPNIGQKFNDAQKDM